MLLYPAGSDGGHSLIPPCDLPHGSDRGQQHRDEGITLEARGGGEDSDVDFSDLGGSKAGSPESPEATGTGQGGRGAGARKPARRGGHSARSATLTAPQVVTRYPSMRSPP